MVVENAEIIIAAVVGLATIMGFLKSYINGTVRRFIDSITRIENIDSRTEKMYERQEDNAEAIYILALSQDDSTDISVSPKAVKEELGVENGLARFGENIYDE